MVVSLLLWVEPAVPDKNKYSRSTQNSSSICNAPLCGRRIGWAGNDPPKLGE